MINSDEQEEECSSIAFNNSGSIMIGGFGDDIKVWKFEKGKINQLNVLEREGNIYIVYYSVKGMSILFQEIRMVILKAGNKEKIIQNGSIIRLRIYLFHQKTSQWVI